VWAYFAQFFGESSVAAWSRAYADTADWQVHELWAGSAGRPFLDCFILLERLHREVAGPVIGAHDRPVPALPALHIERPHAVLAHIGESIGSIGSLLRLVALDAGQCAGCPSTNRPHHCGIIASRSGMSSKMASPPLAALDQRQNWTKSERLSRWGPGQLR
jgi:hypothetical protein